MLSIKDVLRIANCHCDNGFTEPTVAASAAGGWRNQRL